MSWSEGVLSAAQIESFLETGFVRVASGIPLDVLHEWHISAFTRLGYDIYDRTTWHEKRVHLPATKSIALIDLAPQLHAAVCQLVGGAERIKAPSIYDSFIVNLRNDEGAAWLGPSLAQGWHIDGNNYRHFLDSPETGLVCLINWSAVGPRGGGTFLATDSLGPVARYLRDRPGGVLPNDFDWHALRAECSRFEEPLCVAGDAILMHPFLLHAPSQNHSNVPRVLTNYGIVLREPFSLGLTGAARRSPVERAILQALGVRAIAFSAAGPRESFTPERALIARRMLEEERARARSPRNLAPAAKKSPRERSGGIER